ncbi:chlorinating enzyme [Archangium minus]|uniref:Chlorinating enzyme n=1 Tax=Archangium minus TaxID=83450 RepID=A0ABY9WHV0_9BACT|nr:chlorinating enzyme [Archangium violaceum]WNG43366.1 chlorinating enzyme [Archangium minus]
MTTTRQFKLSEKEQQDFDRNGFIGPFTLYSPEEMKAIHKKVRASLLNRDYAPYQTALESTIANYDRHLDVSLLSEHVCRAEIVDRLVDILGEDVLCWRSEFIPKPPGAEGTDWHQADTFEHASGQPQLVWPEEEGGGAGGTINVWTAFTEATERTGCLMFVPGTHKQMYYDESKGMEWDPEKNANVLKEGTRRGFNGYDYRALQKDPHWKPDESRAVNMVMKPGEFIVFRSTLLHASKPNSTTDIPRLGYVARYVPGRVKVYPDTDVVKEFGSEISLERYGTVVVSGKNRQPTNRVRNTNLRGEPFKATGVSLQ